MDWLIRDIATNGPATTEAEVAARPVPPFEGELDPAVPSGSEVVEQ